MLTIYNELLMTNHPIGTNKCKKLKFYCQVEIFGKCVKFGIYVDN